MERVEVPLSKVSTVTDVEASLMLTFTVSSEPKFSETPSRLMVLVVTVECRLGLSAPAEATPLGARRVAGMLGRGRKSLEGVVVFDLGGGAVGVLLPA